MGDPAVDLAVHDQRVDRPAGEGGTTPALGVVVNAVVDALAEFGVAHIEMPLTPERVWRAIHANGGATAR